MNDEKFTSGSSDEDHELCKHIIKEYYNLYCSGVEKLDGYDDLNFHLQPPVFHGSDNVDDSIWPHGYILKIISTERSENIAFIQEYINVLLHLSKGKIPTSVPEPIKNKYGNYYFYWTNPRPNKKDGRHVIIMFNYQDGEELQAYKCDEKLAFSLGQLMSSLHLQLEPFRHSEALKRPNFLWSLESVPIVRNFLNEVCISGNQRNCIERIIDEFESRVLSKMDHLEKGVIHNDLNDRNLLVKRFADQKLNIEFTGILDFSDMVHTAYLFEIAITACYLCLNNPDDPLNLTATLIAGYQRRHLTDMEYNLLKICICARFVQSLVHGLYAHFLDPNNEYALTTQKLGWKLLDLFHNMNNEYFVNRIRELSDPDENTNI